jgi:AcrR family transcriptional regulator
MTQNSSGNEDVRVHRTRQLLLTALMELTVEEGFNAVTVKAICERSTVNRATFYRHYLDKYDLLDQYMDELYELLDRPQGEPNFDSPPAGLVRMLEHLRSHADFYRVMLGPKGYPLFAERIRSYIEKRFRGSMPANVDRSNQDRPPFDMLLRAISSAGLGAILWWLENDLPVSDEQMATWAIQISKANFDLL